MTTIRFEARESTGYAHTWVLGGRGAPESIAGYSFAAEFSRRAGAPEFALGMAPDGLSEGFIIVDPGQIGVRIDAGTLGDIEDTTGRFTLYADLVATPPGGDPYVMATIEGRISDSPAPIDAGPFLAISLTGAPGQSAFETWRRQPGNAGGTEEDFLAGQLGDLSNFLAKAPAEAFGAGGRFRIGNRLYALWDATTGFYFRKLKIPAATKVDDQPAVALRDRIFGAAIGAWFGRRSPELGGAGVRWRIGNRLLATLDIARGFYPRRATLPAATKIDDDLTANLATRLVGAGIGGMLRRLPVEAGGVLRVRWGNRLVLTWTKADGLRPARITLPATARIEDQPGVNLVDRLGGSAMPAIVGSNFAVTTVLDINGRKQLASRRRSDGQRFALTSTGNNALVQVTSDDKVIYHSDLVGRVFWIAADATVGPFGFDATTDLVGFGDSMTAAGSGYFATFAALYPARAAYNQGIGGQRTNQIAARLGAKAVTLSITGNAIPSSGSVTCTPNIDLLRGAAVIKCKVRVAGHDCVLAFDNTANAGAGGYTLTPIAYPGVPVAVSNPVSAIVMTGVVYGAGTAISTAIDIAVLRAGTLLVRAGRNDVGKGDYSQAGVLADIQAMIDVLTPLSKRIVVMGVTNGYGDLPTSMGGSQNSQASSNTILSQIAALNAAIAAAWPGLFVDPLANHVANGGGASQTVSGNTYTVLTSAVLSDGIHENAAGFANTAALNQGVVNSKGF